MSRADSLRAERGGYEAAWLFSRFIRLWPWGRMLLLLPAVSTMLLFLGIPLVTIVVVSFTRSTGWGLSSTFTWDNYAYVLTSATYRSVVFYTLKVALLVTALVTVFGYPIAYFLGRVVRAEHAKMTLILLCVIPSFTSFLTRMVAMIPLLGRTGALNTTLQALGLTEGPLDVLLFSEPAMIGVMVYLWVLFLVGPTYLSLNAINPSLVDAALTLGARPWQVFRYVELPLSIPGMAVGWIFVLTLSMTEFATPMVIGGGKTITLSGSIMNEFKAVLWPTASVVALLLAAITLLLVGALLRLVDVKEL